MLHRLLRRPSAAMVVAIIALFVALDGPATAAKLIDGGSIRRNSITSAQIRNRSLQVTDLSAAAVKTLRATPEKSVGAAQLRPGAVGTDRLTDGAVTSAKLANHAVQSVDLGEGVVGATELAAGAVGATKIGDGAIGPSKIAPGAIGSAAVADGSLRVSDIGDFYGAVSANFTPFLPNTCQVVTVTPQPSSPSDNASIADDVVLVSPVAGWPDPIVLNANPGANNTLRIVACRVGGDATDPQDTIDPPLMTFHYVGFDQP
jgi:hypothetical protein